MATWTSLDILEKILIPLMAAFLGAFIGCYFAFFYQKRLQKHNEKKYLLATLMGYRNTAFKEPDFVKALNMVDIIYYNNKNVKELLHKYLHQGSSELYSSGERLETFFKMILEMGQDIGYTDLKHSDITDFCCPEPIESPQKTGNNEPSMS